MFNLGFTEMLFIAVLALVLIGPKQLPEVARTLGRFLNELKRTTDVIKDEFTAATFKPDDIFKPENKLPQADGHFNNTTHPTTPGHEPGPHAVTQTDDDIKQMQLELTAIDEKANGPKDS